MQSAGPKGSHVVPEDATSGHCVNRRAWSRLQQIVRSFRGALRRGERPKIEAFAPSANVDRREVLVELIHEELEFRIKAGEAADLAAYLERFPELTEDHRAVSELYAAESALRSRTPGIGTIPGHDDAPERFKRYELHAVAGRVAFGVVYRARDTLLGAHRAARGCLRAGMLDAPGAAERFVREARSAAVLR